MSISKELAELKELHESGALTDEVAQRSLGRSMAEMLD